jgi:hypothetical protein
VRERFEAIESDQRLRTGELGTLDEQRKKYMDSLMQVQNQREYAAILREIDTVKAHIGEHEESILSDMAEVETLKADLAEREPAIQEERKRVEAEVAEVEAEVARAQVTVARLEEERRAIEAELPRALVGSVSRLEIGRAGIFLSRVVEGVCQSCYVRVRPQVFQEIRQALLIHSCANCKRLLYHETSLMRARDAGLSSENPNVKVINGGAV